MSDGLITRGSLRRIQNGLSGTFTANGASAVVVPSTHRTPFTISFALKTVGGTPAAAPYMSAAPNGTSFSVKAAAGDTSVYQYLLHMC